MGRTWSYDRAYILSLALERFVASIIVELGMPFRIAVLVILHALPMLLLSLMVIAVLCLRVVDFAVWYILGLGF